VTNHQQTEAAMGSLELFTLGVSLPGIIAAQARRAEAAGWHGLAVVDSQNLAGDAWIALSIAAAHTTDLLLATGVTNPVTRHPAVTAAAAASLQVQSGGRVTLGIGRGDSSLAHLGRAPAPVATLERYLEALQAYLSGQPVPFAALDFHPLSAPPVAELGLAGGPAASRLAWLDPALPKVPVEVAATGERAIAAAARRADRVMFALGAEPERIAWGIGIARRARVAAGLDPDALALGAFVNLVCHPDLDAARRLVSGGLSTVARFAVMHGRVSGPASASQREVLARVHDAYDMRRHTQIGAPQADALTPEFIDRYAVVGAPDHCIARLHELSELGLTRISVVGITAGANPDAARESEQLMAKEVLPAVRGSG
jgi:5,10-methylenetetrahydromethanopterin reductase